MKPIARKPDLARIKQAISFEQIMNRYHFRLKAIAGTGYRGRCPLPTHTNENDTNSFTATRKDVGWVWDCFSASCIANRAGRKGGNILEFVMLMESDSSLFRIGTKLNEWFGLNAWLVNGHGTSTPNSGNATPRKTTGPNCQAPPDSDPTPISTVPAEAEIAAEVNSPLVL